MRKASEITGTFQTHYNPSTGESFLTIQADAKEAPRTVLRASPDGYMRFYGPFGEELLVLSFLDQHDWNTDQINTILDEAWQQESMGKAVQHVYHNTLHTILQFMHQRQDVEAEDEDEAYPSPTLQ